MLPLALGGYRPLTREEMNNLHKNINEGCIDWTDDFYRQETCPATGKVINYGLALRISVEIEPGLHIKKQGRHPVNSREKS